MVIINNTGQIASRWVKEHPHADQLHRVLRHDGSMLISYCGKRIPAAQAMSASGIVCCPACTSLWREHMAKKRSARGIY